MEKTDSTQDIPRTLADLDRVIHEPARLSIMAVLSVVESADFTVGEDFFVLTEGEQQGTVTLQKLGGSPLTPLSGFVSPPDLADPSWVMLGREPGGYLYVIDMGYHRLRALEPESGAVVRDYRLAEQGVEIRCIYADREKLYVASRDALYVYPMEPILSPTAQPGTAPTIGTSSPVPHDPATLELLPPLVLPVEGAALSDMAYRLPGAPSSYRYGVHEGLDFYWTAAGPVSRDTQVLATAEGQVIRADIDYTAPSAQEMADMVTYTQETHHTPADILDAFRGRQVWIDHGHGVATRYCHLDSVAEGLAVGQHVEQGQVIGHAGNSGTPAAYYDEDSEIHLHLEIRIGDGYLGQFLRPVETKRWLKLALAEAT